MVQTYRLPEIIEIARREGRVTVEELASHFDVTLQTIRRDLAELSHAGKLERVHGGAVLASGTSNIGYEERRGINQTGKVDIARACAALIPDNCCIFLNIGTTTEAVAAELLKHEDILVVTNNMNVATTLAHAPGATVVVTGGTLRPSDGGLVGPLTMKTIEQFKFDQAVIGCSALDVEGDILDFDIQEVGVSQRIIRQSRAVTVVADHTKFERTAPARIGSLSDADRFITDRPVDERLARACKEWGTEVIVASAPNGGSASG
jgi:DeoR family glycerol-3-phosphate regulon repressor